MDVALRVLSAVLALVAVGCIALAIVGMVTGRPNDQAGYFIRVAAVLCFAGAVVLNVIAH
jgi:hypothetical protein